MNQTNLRPNWSPSRRDPFCSLLPLRRCRKRRSRRVGGRHGMVCSWIPPSPPPPTPPFASIFPPLMILRYWFWVITMFALNPWWGIFRCSGPIGDSHQVPQPPPPETASLTFWILSELLVWSVFRCGILRLLVAHSLSLEWVVTFSFSIYCILSPSLHFISVFLKKISLLIFLHEPLWPPWSPLGFIFMNHRDGRSRLAYS